MIATSGTAASTRDDDYAATTPPWMVRHFIMRHSEEPPPKPKRVGEPTPRLEPLRQHTHAPNGANVFQSNIGRISRR